MVGRRRKRNSQMLIVTVALALVLAVVVIGGLFLVKDKKNLKKVMVPRLVSDKKQGDVIGEKDIEYVEILCEENDLLSDIMINPVGMALNEDMIAGGIVTGSIMHLDSDISDTERLLKFTDISIFKDIMPGDYVDIRISFANGEDYIVMGHKKIEGIEEDSGILVKVDEEDILKMSSARVDVATYRGTNIYAVKYVQKYQESSKTYYLANKCVAELSTWDPNLVKSIFTTEELKNRSILESKLKKYEIKENQ